jgi:hypothetical protein
MSAGHNFPHSLLRKHTYNGDATHDYTAMYRACAAMMDTVGTLMIFFACACMLVSGAVADAPAFASANISIGEQEAEADLHYVISFNNLDEEDTKLEIEEAERFTDLKLSVFSRIWRSRTNTSLLSASLVSAVSVSDMIVCHRD